MRCSWCHNPESISFQPEWLFYKEKCIGCGRCEEGCYASAKVPVGRVMTVREVLEDVAADIPYYADQGGMTVSGGEPLCQPEFTGELLEAAKKKGIGTALETNLCVPWDRARHPIEQTDLLMADLKIFENAEHERWTGMPNLLVMENLQKADSAGIPLILRTPIVPGITDSAENITAIACFAAKLKKLKYYELLAYHPLGMNKASALGYETNRFKAPRKQHMRLLAKTAIDAAGIRVAVNNVLFDS